MLRRQNRHSWNAGSVIILTLLNIAIIRYAYTGNQQFYPVLLITVPLLALALYYAFAGDGPYNLNGQSKFKKGWRLKLPAPILPGSALGKGLEMMIGNAQCNRPFRSSILNMLLKEEEAVKEGGNIVTRYRLTGGGWLCQVDAGTGGDGHFDSRHFIKITSAPAVKMIELNLLAVAGNINRAGTPLFPDAEGMVHFLGNLREYCGGKPVGFRLAIAEKKEFHEICYAIRKTQIIPDYIVIEGPEDLIAAAQLNGPGQMPVYEALFFAAKTLQLYGLGKETKLIAATHIASGFDILKIIALGANGVCIDVTKHNNIPGQAPGEKPAGAAAKMHAAATKRMRILNTVAGLMDNCGFKSVADITLPDFFRKMAIG